MEEEQLQKDSNIFTQSQVQVQIPQFEELQPPNSSQNSEFLLQDTDQKFQSSQWNLHFDALNQLREWNKFRSQEFLTQILNPQTLSHILNASENLRSTVQWTCLKLIKEIFQVHSITAINDISVQKMTVKIYEKANCDKKFLRTEAQSGVKVLEENKDCLCGPVISQLCQLNFDKNAQICEMVCLSTTTILKKHIQNFQTLSPQDIESLVSTIAKNLEGKRAKMKNSAKELCIFLNKNVGKQIFDSLPENHLKLVQSNLHEKQQKARTNFRDFKKVKSNFLSHSQTVSYPNNDDENSNSISGNGVHIMSQNGNGLPKHSNFNNNNSQNQNIDNILVLEKTQSLNLNEHNSNSNNCNSNSNLNSNSNNNRNSQFQSNHSNNNSNNIQENEI